MDLEVFRKYNYRVLVIDTGNGLLFSISRVYYNYDGVPCTYGIEAAQAYGDSVEELQKETQDFCKAFDKPILWGDNRFPEEYKKD